MTNRRYATSPEELATLDDIRSRTGLEFIQAIMSGELAGAPIAGLLDFDLVHASAGEVVFRGTPKFEHYNPIGSVHGGWFGTLLDSCMACAVQTMLPKGKGYTTLEYKLNILRAARAGGPPIRAEGRVIHFGRSTATAEGRMVDDDGKLYATGTTTCLILDL